MAEGYASMFEIDPTYLNPAELDYKLGIRNVTGLMSERDKTGFLRKEFRKEKEGEVKLPTLKIENVVDELKLCVSKIRDLGSQLMEAHDKKEAVVIPSLQTHLAHYLGRFARLEIQDENLIEEIKKVAVAVKEKLNSSLTIAGRGRGSRLSLATQMGSPKQCVSPELVAELVNSFRAAGISKQQQQDMGPPPPPPSHQFEDANTSEMNPIFSQMPSDIQFVPRYEYGRPIPINQWGFSFSGDGLGLSLNDFLSRVDIFARSGGVSHRQVFLSMYHLLTGRAQEWYRANYARWSTWDEMVIALRAEFLPINYDFLLREEILNRYQLKTESFSSFMTHLNILFQRVHPPFDSNYKLFVVKRNMLPEYSFQLATIIIESLEQLTTLCKQMDEAKFMDARRQDYSNCLVEPACFPKQQTRSVAAIDFNNRRESFRYDNRNLDNGRSNENANNEHVIQRDRKFRGRQRSLCWNCEREGHRHFDCPSSNRKIFCWYCGRKGVTSQTCPRRHTIGSGNEAAEAQ